MTYLKERTEISDKNIHTAYLYTDFKIWYKEHNLNEKIPCSKHFLDGIRKYKEVEKNIRINKKNSCGIRNLQLL